MTGIPARICDDAKIADVAAKVLAALLNLKGAPLNSTAALCRGPLLTAAEKVQVVMPAKDAFGLATGRHGIAWEATYGQIGLFLPNYAPPTDGAPGSWDGQAIVVATGVVKDDEVLTLLEGLLTHLQ